MVPPADGDNLGIIPSQYMIGLEFIFEQQKKKTVAELALFTEKEGFFLYIFLNCYFICLFFVLTPGEDTIQERRNVGSWRSLLRSRYYGRHATLLHISTGERYVTTLVTAANESRIATF